LHPEIASFSTIGSSTTGANKVWALTIGNPATAQRRILHVAGLHARELANPESLLRWAEEAVHKLASGHGGDGPWTARTAVALIGLANPDGYARVLSGLDQGDEQMIWHRGNMRSPRPVDLNRNFAANWDNVAAQPDTPYFKGSASMSEAEVSNIAAFATDFQPTAVLDWHSPAPAVYPAKLLPGEPTDGTDSSMQLARQVGQIMEYPAIRSDRQKSGVTGGTLKDWAHQTFKVPAVTVETGRNHHQSDEEFADTDRRIRRALDAIAADNLS
jgi:hypothetical protein